MKNANLLRYPHSSSLRHTSMYASVLAISGALHLDVLDQPAQPNFFTDLPGKKYLKLKSSVTTGM